MPVRDTYDVSVMINKRLVLDKLCSRKKYNPTGIFFTWAIHFQESTFEIIFAAYSGHDFVVYLFRNTKVYVWSKLFTNSDEKKTIVIHG